MKLSAINIKKESFLQGDMVVWMILLALCMISIVEVYSASSRMTYNSLNYWDPVIEHTTYILAGLFVAWLVHKAHCKSFKGLSVLGMVVSIALLFAVLFMGKINGAARWIRILGIAVSCGYICNEPKTD